MEVIYNESKDITLTLREEEVKKLLEILFKGPTKLFFDDYDQKTKEYDTLLTGVSNKPKVEFFLGYCSDEGGIFEKAVDIEKGLGKIVLPDANEQKWPGLINLSEQGMNYFKEGWPKGVTHNGGGKLIIIKE